MRAVVHVTPSVEVWTVKPLSAAKREAFVALKALTRTLLTVAGAASLTVSRSSGPALYAAVPSFVAHTAGGGVVEGELRRSAVVLAGDVDDRRAGSGRGEVRGELDDLGGGAAGRDREALDRLRPEAGRLDRHG